MAGLRKPLRQAREPRIQCTQFAAAASHATVPSGVCNVPMQRGSGAVTPEEIRTVEEDAASGKPVAAAAAQGVIRLFDVPGRRPAHRSFVPLTPNERLALACRASDWPEAQI